MTSAVPRRLPHPHPWDRHLSPEDPEPDLLRYGSLPVAWGRHFAHTPEAPALRELAGSWVTYAELDARSRACAGTLAAAGVERGDRLLVSARPSTDLVAWHVGALRLGAVVVPANTAYGPTELGHIVADAEPAAAVIDDASREAPLGAIPVFLIGAEPTPGVTDVELDRTGAGDPALIGYTSGTTGRPKGAVLSHGNLLASAEALRLAWRWGPADRLILALPLFHMHGLGVGVHGTLVAGASMVLLPRFEVDTVLDAARDDEGSLFFGVPTMYARLAQSSRVPELARLRLCVSGSAPLPAEVSQAISEASGQRVLERYGMTETVMNLSNPYDGERRPGSVGFPLPGVEVELSEGDSGEILVRGPNVFAGYWNNPDATQAAFEDGWFRTGDVAEKDPDGYFRIVGRTKELIITGGFNVYPREVEEAIELHSAVVEAAVCGTPDPEWGEVVTAFVVVRRPLQDGELMAHCEPLLAPFKRPRIVHLVAALPRNALGKIQRSELAAIPPEPLGEIQRSEHGSPP